jgi:hypothetical protein
MAYDEALAERVRGVLATRPMVEEKKMFGGLTFMVDGQMCCGVMKDDLAVRTLDPTSDLALPHTRPLDFNGKMTTGLVLVAPAGLGDDRGLREWIQRGLDYIAANPRSAKSARRRT